MHSENMENPGVLKTCYIPDTHMLDEAEIRDKR